MDVKARIGLLIQAQGAHRAASEIDTVARSTKRVGDETATTGRRMRETDRHRARFHQGLMGLAGAARFGVAALGGAGLVGVLHDSVKEYRESWKVGRATNAVIKSTGGAAHVTAKGVGNLANSLSLKAGIDDEAIQSGENLLLTFRAIHNEAGKGNDIFNQTTKAAVDMSAAFTAAGKSMSVADASLQLGKALNDPAKGMTRLQRVGVSFTKGQIDQVKALEASGHHMQAQKIILRELSKEFGGMAAKTADPLQKLGVAWKNLEETLGKALAPVLSKVAGGLATFVGQLQSGRGAGGAFRTVLIGVWTVVKAVAAPLIAAVKWVARLVQGSGKMGHGVSRDFRAIWTVAKEMGHVVGWVLRNLSGPVFHAFVGTAKNLLHGLAVAFTGLWQMVKGVANIIAGIFTLNFGRAWCGLKQLFSGGVKYLIGAFLTVTGPIRAIAVAVWGALKTGLQGAINWIEDRLNSIIRIWNATAGRLLGSIGLISTASTQAAANVAAAGQGLSTFQHAQAGNSRVGVGGSTDLPHGAVGRATGGIVRHGEVTIVGERGPELARFPAGTEIIPRVAPLPEHMDTTGGGMRLHPDDVDRLVAGFAAAVNDQRVVLDLVGPWLLVHRV